jgi:hypothetical protein
MATSAKEGMRCNHGNPTMLNSRKPMMNKFYLSNSNLNYFKIFEAMGFSHRGPLQNLMKICQAVQNVYRSFMPKSTMPLGYFCPTVNK